MADEPARNSREVADIIGQGVVRRTYVHLDAPPPIERAYRPSALGNPPPKQRRRDRA
ncbi:MAG: hypothetical protein Q8N19_12755 [Phenylobacterium sp.]|uniref:hypothetical protein n=1 Tax=Phenylobacterium sp. TaxID=1871053 RepID=UPI002734938D|nr:hypothetical protein [Phenylobacterium sp.]MDP3117971.1 hypothetical protein [Phenylobacterium sp.]